MCGLQYNDLVEVHNKYRSKGFEIIAAPCNQFGAQEPGSNAEIKKFAQARGAKFPLLSKLDVNGPESASHICCEHQSLLRANATMGQAGRDTLTHHTVVGHILCTVYQVQSVVECTERGPSPCMLVHCDVG